MSTKKKESDAPEMILEKKHSKPQERQNDIQARIDRKSVV